MTILSSVLKHKNIFLFFSIFLFYHLICELLSLLLPIVFLQLFFFKVSFLKSVLWKISDKIPK